MTSVRFCGCQSPNEQSAKDSTFTNLNQPLATRLAHLKLPSVREDNGDR